MVKNDNLSKLTHQLCELRLEERRVRSDIRHLVARNATQSDRILADARLVKQILAQAADYCVRHAGTDLCRISG